MNNSFKDITDKMGIPLWYDIHGYPRYSDFHPSETYNIYAECVIYMMIGCQACREKFMVAESIATHYMYEINKFKEFCDKQKSKSISNHIVPFFQSLSSDEIARLLHYGDPPNHGCVGDTMNCDDLKIVQFWSRGNAGCNWKRVKKLEIDLPDSL